MSALWVSQKLSISGLLYMKSCWVHAQVTKICNSTINWLDYGNSFSGIQTDCLTQTVCILERKPLVSIMQNQHSSYSMSSSRNTDESCRLGVWLFHDNAPAHRSLVAQQALCDCEFVQLNHSTYSPGSQWLFPNKKSEVPSLWHLVYRWWITDDRCRGMVWESKQKILF